MYKYISLLIQLLKKVKDCRRSQGKRHPLWLILLLVILGTMIGYMGYRAWARFCQTEGLFIAQALKIKCTQWPSDSRIKRAMIRIKSDNFINMFPKWMR